MQFKTARGRWVLVATVLGSALTGIDATVVGIALPSIGRQFHTGLADLQWVTNGYALTLSGLLLLGGALGDRLGRRRIFEIGTVIFAVASLLCGLAPSVPALIAARALEGVGGALLTPASLAILNASFARDDRSTAIGAWAGLGGVATAIGPFLGGWLISAVSWRLIFFINLPVAVAVIVVSRRFVPESLDPSSHGRLDVVGSVIHSVGLAALVYGLTEGPSFGWSSSIPVIALGAGFVLLVAFISWEGRRPEALLPLGLFRSTQFSGTNAATFVVYAALGGALFLLPIDLQQVVGYSPLAAGASLLPITVIMLLLSARSGRLATRVGPRLQMTVGPVVAGAGLALLARVGQRGNFVTDVLPAMVVLGLGLATVVSPLTATAMSSAPEGSSGIASAVNNNLARVGGLVAVALLPAAAGITGTTYLHPSAFSAGFHTAMLISAAAAAGGGLVAFVTVRDRPPAVRPAEPCFSCAVAGTLGAPAVRSTGGHSGEARS